MTNIIGLCFVLLSPILLYILRYARTFSFTKPWLPPGPRPWPMVGNLLQLGKKPHISMTRFAQIHGPLISLKLGSQLYIVGSSPAAAAEILKTHDRVLSGRAVTQSSPFRGSRIDGFSIVWAHECTQTWKSLRTLCRSELFSGKAIELQGSLREKKSNEMVEYLRAMQGKVVSIREVLYHSVLNTMSNLLLSKDLLSFEEQGDASGLKAKISRVVELLATPNISDFYPIFAELDIQGLKKKTRQSTNQLADVWQVFIEERKSQTSAYGDQQQQDFLDVFLANNFSDDQINALFSELFIIGTDTTTTAVEWALTELIKNKEAMEKLREEVREGANDQKTIKESQISELPYLQACVKETLRLHPPGPLLVPHRAVEACQIMNFKIPKNSVVVVNFWAIGHDPNCWEDPLKFKPERFVGSSLDFKGKDYEYLPFGSGRRMCPGLPFAATMVPLLLASLVAFFDWYLPNGDDPARLDMNDKLGDISLLKEKPLLVIPYERKFI